MEDIILSQCVACRHKHFGKPTCDAFPAGIPHELSADLVDHREPYTGDGGVRFEAVPGRDTPFATGKLELLKDAPWRKGPLGRSE
jgi:hypothetical protein